MAMIISQFSRGRRDTLHSGLSLYLKFLARIRWVARERIRARIAALKAGLKLTPAQEKNWPALETALREQAKARAARIAEWREKARNLSMSAFLKRAADHYDVVDRVACNNSVLVGRRQYVWADAIG